MERAFPTEIAALRSRGRKLAEASALVVDADCSGPSRRTWLHLCKAVWHEAEAQAVGDLRIAVTGEHLAFYERLLLESVGPGRSYKVLNNVFAYPLRLRLTSVGRKHASRENRPGALLRRSLLGL
jgi:hypothetical protein